MPRKLLINFRGLKTLGFVFKFTRAQKTSTTNTNILSEVCNRYITFIPTLRKWGFLQTIISHLQILLIKYWPLLALIIVIFVFFARLFFPPSIFVTPDYGRSDAWHLSIANKYYYAQELKKNRLPIWNPHIGTGFPTLAEGQTGIFFLPNLILFKFLPFALAYNFSIIFAFILAASGTYLFCRSLGLNKTAAVYGGLIFALGGFLMVHIPHLHLIQTASLLPWLFWATNEFFQKRKILYLILLSIILSQQIFAGFPQLVFYGLVALFIYIVLKIYTLKKAKFKLSVAILASICLGLIIASVQILPTYELLNNSTRESSPRSILEQFPYKPKNLLQFLDPFVLGSPKNGSYPRWIPGQWGIFWESIAYIGLIPLSFSLAVTIGNLGGKTRQRHLILFFAVLAVLSILLAFGGSSPLHPIFSFPPFSIFRVPSRFLLITQFSLTILAAFYLQKISMKKIISAAIFLISLVNLYFLFGLYNPTGSTKNWFADPHTAQLLKEKNAQRIFTIGQMIPWNENFGGKGWQDNDYFYFARNSLDQNSNLIFGVNQLAAYESLLPRRQAMFNITLLAKETKIENNKIILSNKASEILTSAGVSHIISPFEIENEKFSQVYETETFNKNTFKIFENKQKPRRVFVTENFQEATSIPQLTKTLLDDNFNSSSEIVLENKPQTKNLNLKNWSAQITEETPTKVIVNADVAGTGFLVLTDSFYPGWKVFDNGIETQILPANINQRAIYLNEGKHQIIFKYLPESLRLGTYLSLASVSILILVFLKFKNFKKIE